jgi:hypothetical protein
MKLLLRRDQKAGMMGMGKINFILDVRAEISDEEKADIKKYKLGKTLLYTRSRFVDRYGGFRGFVSAVAFRMRNLTITVDDLVGGKHIVCKDVVEMIAAEETIKDACRTFQQVLQAASHFGGEEVLEIA